MTTAEYLILFICLANLVFNVLNYNNLLHLDGSIDERLRDLDTTIANRVRAFLKVFRKSKATEHMANKDKLK